MDEGRNWGHAMVNGAKIYVEGGGDTNNARSVCRKSFSTLIANIGLAGRLPRIIPCGGRQQAFEDFVIACKDSGGSFIGLLVDSEDPMKDVEQPWEHLRQ